MERKNAWNSYESAQIKELEELCSGYRHFLDTGKTERECIKEAVRLATLAGYRDLEDIIKNKEEISEAFSSLFCKAK